MSRTDIAIKVENVTKVYRIGMEEIVHDSLGAAMFDLMKRPLENYRKYRSLYKFEDVATTKESTGGADGPDILWALKGVSFDVRQGEVLGVIGQNGAGKSTLLKVLARITPPTSGHAEIRGRLSSLLEVGTGFHQELTGRENVYLNGTILGMKKREVDRKFDEIVDFSGVQKFLDTPVKRYSSGMRVRLAFAVAAQLEPEILLIDEVLAVGDAAFQKKCLSKMQDVGKHGRTVVFVSHNMGAITELCERVIWLDNGEVRLDGGSVDVVSAYLSAGAQGAATWVSSTPNDPSKDLQVKSARILSSDGQPSAVVDFANEFRIEIGYQLNITASGLAIFYRLTNSQGNILWTAWDTDNTDWNAYSRRPGTYFSTCVIPANLLRPGRYYVSVGARRMKQNWYYDHVLAFDVSEVGYTLRARPGILSPYLEWKVIRSGGEDEVA